MNQTNEFWSSIKTCMKVRSFTEFHLIYTQQMLKVLKLALILAVVIMCDSYKILDALKFMINWKFSSVLKCQNIMVVTEILLLSLEILKVLWSPCATPPLTVWQPFSSSLDAIKCVVCWSVRKLINSLALGKFEWKFRHVIFKQILVIDE